MDYCFLGRALKSEIPKEAGDLKKPESEDEGLLPVLVMVDQATGCTFSAVVTKGVNSYALRVVTEGLKFLGRQGKAILMTDGEHAIKALAEAAAKEMKGLQLQHAPKGSHASNGAAEKADKYAHLSMPLETRYPGYRLKTEGHVFPWLVRHASWLITRFLVKDDGRTPYERLRGRDYKGEIVDYAEVVHYKLEAERVGKLDPQASVGVWLGKSLSSDEHLIGTSQGIRRCRSIWRRPENKRWEQARLNAVTGTPWQPKGSLTIVPQDNQRLPAPGTPAPGTPGGGRQRSVYITVERQIKHGPTPGCPGCHCSDDYPKKHSKACRLRFESIYQKGGEGEADAGGPAQSADAPLSRAPNGQALTRAAPLRKAKQPPVPRIGREPSGQECQDWGEKSST